MRTGWKKTIVLAACLFSVTVLGGCTNWKKKYEALNVAYENLKGQRENDMTVKGKLEEELSQKDQTIEQLRKQIEDQKKTPGEATGFGNEYPVKFDAKAGTVTVTLPDAILFASGKAELKNATNKALDHIESVLQSKYRSRQIDVVGHTDTDPIKKSSWQDNWQLSAERALAVTRYLIKRGISEDQIRAVACGETRPVDSNATAAGKARNRRVEIVVHMR
jgi:chemotaxis protein MotB